MPDPSMSLRPVVRSAGAELSPEQHAALTDLRVTKSLGVPAYARLSFSVEVAGTAITPKLGDQLEIGIDGDENSSWTLFSGVVVGLGVELDTGFNQNLTVEAYDKLYLLGRQSAAATYLQQSPTDIVEKLAREAGLSVSIASALGTSPRVSAYRYGTAYAYIDALVREAGCEWHVEGTKLHITPRAGGTSDEFAVKAGQNLMAFAARVSASDHVDKVTVTGWDVKTKAVITGVATSDGAGARSVVANAAGSEVKKSAAAGKTAVSIPRPVADQAEADRLAKGIMHRSEASLLRARGEVVPDSAVEPGVLLVLEGLAGGWDGKYYCTEVEHVWGRGSFRTFFEVGSAEPESLVDLFGSSPSAPLQRMLGGLTVGIVTNNKDPESWNRVKVKLPYLSDSEESGWARVLQAGAGASRGWAMLPEIDDEVLVGFEHGDIDRPYVLGGLANGKDAPKYGHADVLKSGKVQERVFNSRVGHELRFTDGGAANTQSISMHTAKKEAMLWLGGEKLEVQAQGIPVKVYNDKGSIEINKNGDITLKGANIILKATQDVTIDAGANVTVKSAVNTAVTADAKLDLKSNAPATLESSAITTVKGTMVKIN